MNNIISSQLNENEILTNGVHFYWSQKSPEIAKNIYKENCKPGDVIMDPFLGGGSSLYGIRDSNYKFIGIDINELPIRIAKFNIQSISNELIEKIQNDLDTLKLKFKDIYSYTTNSGLKLEILKIMFDNKESPKVKEISFIDDKGNKFNDSMFPYLKDEYIYRFNEYKSKILEIENPLLIKNSRIAIKENMHLSDIFSPITFFLLSMIKEEIKNNEDFKFLLSSVLQLCKLTDSKSQSQFPFWIPKINIVERNIFYTLQKKLNSLKKFKDVKRIEELYDFGGLINYSENCCLLFNKPIQDITKKNIPENSVDFILTDPPYYDQIAYSEYLKIWEFFVGYQSNLKDEIIVSQRDVESSGETEYYIRFEEAFKIIYNKLKTNGKLFLYFKDSRLDKTGVIINILDKIGFKFTDHEYLDTLKYTYKQNSSTRTTITGDSILKFTKAINNKTDVDKDIVSISHKNQAESIIKYFVQTYLFTNKNASLGEIFNNGLVKTLYDNKALDLIKNSQEVVNIVEDICEYDKLKRTYKLKDSSFTNKLFLGDCIKLLKHFPNDSIDCCITDPPYNISGHEDKKEIGWYKSNKLWKSTKGFNKINEQWDKFTNTDYDEFTVEWLSEIKRIVKPNGNIAIFGSYHNIYKIGYFLEKLDFRVINSIVWYKRNAFPNITQRMFCESTEHIVWATNNNKKNAKNWTFNYNAMKQMNGGVQMRNLFDIPMTKKSEKTFGKHPSQKPLEVINRLVLSLSNAGDFIIDPFIGSGTTALSSKVNNRLFVGIDTNFKYLEIAQARITNIQNINYGLEFSKEEKKINEIKLFE